MKKIVLLVFAFVLFLSVVSFSATRTAVATGNWTSTSSWDCGCIPTDADHVIIPLGIKITVPWPGVDMLNFAYNIVITVYGELVLSSSTLSLNGADQMIIASGGKVSATGLGGLVTSGFTPIVNFPINGPATITNGALPIALNYFEAEEASSGVLVKWESAIEENLARYVVERSADGVTFEDLQSISINGNSAVSKVYEIVDQHPRLGRSYYRLRTEDIDGSTETFKVVAVVVRNLPASIHVYPNPLVNGMLTIDSNAKFSEGDYLVVMTSLGKPVSKLMLSGFSNDLMLNALESGVYYIECRTRFGTFKERLIKP
jgi:hypothetical protein